VANWWELPEYEAAEKKLQRASWEAVSCLNSAAYSNGVLSPRMLERAKLAAKEALEAHQELDRIQQENA
jgi:hypothetical protein